MAKRVQLIRHTSGTADTFVGLEGEITVDLTNDQLRVHDGVTPGGIAQARQDLSTTQAATNSNDGKMTAALVVLVEALDALTTVHEARLDTIEANIIPGGTVMLFMQAAAPTGWTQVVSHNNKALRIVNGAGAGSGGTEAFTAIFNAATTKTTNNHTLNTNQIPAHTHAAGALSAEYNGAHTHAVGGSGTDPYQAPPDNISLTTYPGSVNYNTSSAGGHTHSVTGSTGNNTTAGSGHSHTLTLDLQYVDIIACTKDAF